MNVEQGMKTDQKIAAIILNYNSSEDVKKCLSFLEKQREIDLEMIVVDNASSNQGEQEKVAELCDNYNAVFIENKKNEGFSVGNNVGLQRAIDDGADWCLIINPDVELRNTLYISEALRIAQKYPKAVVIGTNVLMPDGSRQNPMRECTYFEDLLWPLDAIKYKLGLWEKYLAKNCTGYCEKVSGCCFFIKSSFLLKIDFLDSNVFLYCEEPILAKQVVKLGYKELYIKEITAYHEHFESKKGSNAKRMIIFIESRKYYIKKYSGYKGIKCQLLLLSKNLQKMVWKHRG